MDNESRYKFQTFIRAFEPLTWSDVNNWCLIVGVERRNYVVAIQRTPDTASVRVVAGCRYFTMAQARKHWTRRGQNRLQRVHSMAILAMIETGLASLSWRGLITEGERNRAMKALKGK